MRQQHRIIDFRNLDQADIGQIPGKISRLYHKYQAGITVPDRGFVVFPSVVDDILNAAGGKNLIAADSIPDAIRAELLGAYHGAKFGAERIRVAVRAALDVEDGRNMSYAGGSESLINVLGAKDFLAAVAQCISASCGGRMDAYRKRNNSNGALRLYILVQEMVFQGECNNGSDKFAIVFTRSPFNPDEVLVQATYGGGEVLTSGSETGDVYRLDRSGKLLGRSISRKRMMSTPRGLVPFSSDRQDNAALEEYEIAQLVSFALRIEELEGGIPQDCEICFSTDWAGIHDVVLVQNRPITTAVAFDELVRKQLVIDMQKRSDAGIARLKHMNNAITRTAYSDQNIVELLGRNPSLMAFGMFTYIFAHGDGAIRRGRNSMGYDIGGELKSGFFELVAGQPRCSIVHDALTYRIHGVHFHDYVRGFVLPYLEAIRENPQCANYPEVVLYEQHPTKELLEERFGKGIGRTYAKQYTQFFAGIRKHERTFAKTFCRAHEPRLNRLAAYFHGEDASVLPVETLVRECRYMLDFLRTEACVWFVVAARLGFFAYARLRKRLHGAYDQIEASRRLDILTAGLPDDPTLEFNCSLADVRDGKSDLAGLLDHYGHLGFNELEIAGVRYRENPDVLRMLATNLAAQPRAEFQKRVEEYEELRGEMLAECGNERGEWAKDIDAARTYLALRERIKFGYLKFYDAIRARLLAIEQMLGWDRNMIFHLDPRELFRLVGNEHNAHSKALWRAEHHVAEQQFDVPKVMFSDELDRIAIPDFAAHDNDVALAGLGASPYVAEGRAVIVHDPNDGEKVAQITEGCILVVPSADPAWSPIVCMLGSRGGLITEVGGPLAHGAIICREMRTASVADIANATRIIKDGERVRIDGRDPQNGKVYLLDR